MIFWPIPGKSFSLPLFFTYFGANLVKGPQMSFHLVKCSLVGHLILHILVDKNDYFY